MNNNNNNNSKNNALHILDVKWKPTIKNTIQNCIETQFNHKVFTHNGNLSSLTGNMSLSAKLVNL